MPPQTQPTRFEFLQGRSVWRNLPAPHPQYQCRALVDPYAGCALGCRYCFGATEESVSVTDPLDYRVGVRTDAVFAVARALKEAGGPVSTVLGALSDPYQPAEERFSLTRRCLEVLIAADCPVHVLTKSAGVLRDADLLAPHSQKGLAIVTVSVASLKDSVVDWMEPHAPSPARRLALVGTLARRGVMAGVALAPILPRLTDNPVDLRALFDAIADCGAAYVLPSGFTLASRAFLGVLRDHHPELVPFYERLGNDGAAELDPWRAELWKTLQQISLAHRLPLRLPVDGAGLPDTLPSATWGTEPVVEPR